MALVIGVSIPLVIAYLIWRASAHSELDPVELVACMEKHILPDLKSTSLRRLSGSSEQKATNQEPASLPPVPADDERTAANSAE